MIPVTIQEVNVEVDMGLLNTLLARCRYGNEVNTTLGSSRTHKSAGFAIVPLRKC